MTMIKIKIAAIVSASLVAVFFGCGRKEETPGEKSKVEKAVQEAVTKEFKMYEGAKAAIEKTDKEAQARMEKEKEVK